MSQEKPPVIYSTQMPLCEIDRMQILDMARLHYKSSMRPAEYLVMVGGDVELRHLDGWRLAAWKLLCRLERRIDRLKRRLFRSAVRRDSKP